MKIGAIIQARMNSQRLPGKVLRNIAGKPLLQYLLERTERCDGLDAVVVATSEEASDQPIVDFCRDFGAACMRGPLFDVAGRFKQVLDKCRFSAFVRVSADSPLLDQRLIDKAVKIFRQGDFEIVTNVLKRTYPTGQSVEVLNASTFMDGYKQMQNSEDREHLTKFFYKNYKNFRIFNFVSERDYSKQRLSVDTSKDLEIISSIIERMDRSHWQYDLEGILKIYREVSKN